MAKTPKPGPVPLAPVFANLTASDEFLNKVKPEEWRHMAALLPTDWTEAQRADCMAAVHGTCWMLQHREQRTPAEMLAGLKRVQRACSELRLALDAVPMAVWLHGDAAGLVDPVPVSGGPGIGLGSLLHLAADELTPMGDPMLFPSDLVQHVRPLLERLATNAEDAKALFPALARQSKPTIAVARFVVGRMAEVCEKIGGEPLARTGPEWFVELMRAMAPAAGLGAIGVDVVRAVLTERQAHR